MVKRVWIMMIMGVIAMGLMGCESVTNQYSPEQVINNALEEANSPGSYYAEMEMKTIEKSKVTFQSTTKEWHSKDGKVRTETENIDDGNKSIIVNDINTLLMYNVGEKQAYIIMDDPDLQAFNQSSPRELTQYMLEMLQNTHHITVKGEEEILGYASYHLVAKAKEDSTFFGDLELWIDKKNWMTLKTISDSGDSKGEMIYTKIDFKVKMPDEIFTLDLPKDVEVIDFNDIFKKAEVTLEEAVEKMDQSFLYFPENNGWQITAIEMTETEEELNEKEVSIDYKKGDLPLLTMSVVESPEQIIEDELMFADVESVTIRNQRGVYSDLGDIRMLFWQEDGLSYSITIIDPNVSVEDLQKLADEMEFVE